MTTWSLNIQNEADSLLPDPSKCVQNPFMNEASRSRGRLPRKG